MSPDFGQTFPESIATGWHLIFNSLYILPTPFLNGTISFGATRVAWGKIITGLLVFYMINFIFSMKLRLSFVTLFLLIEMESIFLKYQPNIGIFKSSLFSMKIGELNTVCK